MASFNGKLPDESLNRQWFRTLVEDKVLIEGLRQFYKEHKPHSALGCEGDSPYRK